jgi:hypothetical protein
VISLSEENGSQAEPKSKIFVPCEKFFSVQRVEARGVAKWRRDVFNHFNEAQFFVASCNKFFGQSGPRAEDENLATMHLKCEKTRHKM